MKANMAFGNVSHSSVMQRLAVLMLTIIFVVAQESPREEGEGFPVG